MRLNNRFIVSLNVAYLTILLIQANSWAGTDVSTVKLAALPAWAQDSLYIGSFLSIDAVMKAEGLTRFQAVELQNQMKDLEEKGKSSQEAYDLALSQVKAGQYESAWKPVKFERPADYIVALDMDETLLIQWYKTGEAGNADITGLYPDTVGSKVSPTYVKLTPGAEKLILDLKGDPFCKGVVIFSAKEDRAALDLIAKWRFSDGSPLRAHIDGVFTRNHLILGSKTLIPSKDLRIFDESLKHVVLVDDNPARVMQPALLRAQPKYDADFEDKALRSGNAALVTHYGIALDGARAEIIESAGAANAMNIPFSQAFLPYSYSGNRIFQNLTKVLRSAVKALEATRLNPELQEAVFYEVKKP